MTGTETENDNDETSIKLFRKMCIRDRNMTYYEAFSEARKALNSEEKTGSVGENIILQDNFDMKA